jgi:hypothetical protein
MHWALDALILHPRVFGLALALAFRIQNPVASLVAFRASLSAASQATRIYPRAGLACLSGINVESINAGLAAISITGFAVISAGFTLEECFVEIVSIHTAGALPLLHEAGTAGSLAGSTR